MITTFDQYLAAAKQRIPMMKTASRTAVAAMPFSVFELAGNPGAGVLAGTSVAAGVVPTDATAGCPAIDAFGVGNVGYLSAVEYGATVAERLTVFDMLWKGGAYPFNAAQALAAQPSFAGRLPGGSFRGLEIWIEVVTAFTGNPTIAVTYTNQDGTQGQTTGAIATGSALTLGRFFQLPLQAGDSGVQKIESVTGTIATVGTFNVLILRRLWSGRAPVIGGGDKHGPDKTGMPIVYDTSALILMCAPDSTATGIPEVTLEICNG